MTPQPSRLAFSSGLSDRRVIDADSTAVLAFDDGTRIPCDRFLVRCFSDVMRRLLEDCECEVDDRGRTVLPVPGQAAEPYWVAVDMLHGSAAPWSLTDAGAVVAVMACMEYLGVTVYDYVMEAHLWVLLENEDVGAVLPHLPRLARNSVLAPKAIKHLIKRRPTWERFRKDVLAPLEGVADPAVCEAVMAYAPNFFPPALLACWALDACTGLTRDHALRLASRHGIMYHPREFPAVARKLLATFRGRGWEDAGSGGTGDITGAAVVKLLRTTLQALDTYDIVPHSVNKAHGSLLTYSHISLTSASLTLASSRVPARMHLAKWLRVHVCQDGRLDVIFQPACMEVPAGRTDVQVRVMCFDEIDNVAESWHLFEGVGPFSDDDPEDAFTLAHATATAGDHAGVVAMLGAGDAHAMRIDFFYGPESVLESPFDEAACELSFAA